MVQYSCVPGWVQNMKYDLAVDSSACMYSCINTNHPNAHLRVRRYIAHPTCALSVPFHRTIYLHSPVTILPHHPFRWLRLPAAQPPRDQIIPPARSLSSMPMHCAPTSCGELNQRKALFFSLCLSLCLSLFLFLSLSLSLSFSLSLSLSLYVYMRVCICIYICIYS